MRLPQRFKRVPHQDPGDEQDIILPAYPSQTKMDITNNVKTYHSSDFEPMRRDTENTAGGFITDEYTISHRKSIIERLEEHEHLRFGTRFISFLNNNFVAGWRAGLLRAFLFSLAALVANISVFLWMFINYDPVKGTGLITKANCAEVGRIETGVKIGLNIVSTLVLSASTYAMQGTTSPTREEVDKAHSKGKWLEIGTQSWRNLIYVSKRHAAIWSVLAFTSLPLHLVFNAVFFTTTETYQYAVAVVDQSFLSNTAFQITSENSSPTLPQFEQWVFAHKECRGGICSWDIEDDTTVIQLLNDVRDPRRRINSTDSQITNDAQSISTPHSYRQLTRQQCLESYTEGFMQSYSDVVVVSKNTQPNTPILWTRYPQSIMTTDKKQSNQDPFHWICNDVLRNHNEKDRCSKRFALEKIGSENWTVYGHPVDYCFARIEPALCHLQYNAYIMLAVIVFSVIKVSAIAILVFTHPDGDFLRTTGDAVTSFLKRQDQTTKNMCLVSSAQIRRHGFQLLYPPQTFSNARPRWWTSANTTEFFSTVGISAAYVIILSSTLYWAIAETNGTAFDSGLGRPNIQSLANLRPDEARSSVIVPTIITANVPQLGFSLLYVFYINMWSKLLIADEFDRLTRFKKGLRISESPRGQQRASHFFTLPIRYAFPLMASSAMLHWLCSQSLFMARFDGMRDGQVDSKDRLVRLGYNATGIIALTTVNLGLFVVTICVAGFRRLSTGLGEMSMSVVISAACHVKRHEVEPWLKAVQWGDVSAGFGEVEDGQILRHCAFTSLVAERPLEGHAYR